MEVSIFKDWVQKWFKGLAAQAVILLNGAQGPLQYLHRTMLRERFSVTGKWESTVGTYTRVMADVVAMDSSLPLKRRDSFGKANGDIPKQGMKMQLNENQLTELDTMRAVGVEEDALVERIFEDTGKVIEGVYERNEKMFLQGLSTGVVLVEDIENTGTGVRLDYGYLAANKFGVDVLWSNPAAKPFDDIMRLVRTAKAKGVVFRNVMTDSATIERIAATAQAKEYYAFMQNFTGTNVPALDLDQLQRVFNNRFGFGFQLVDRSVIYEKNGNQTSLTPWQAGNMVFLTTNQVGDLIYARLAEEAHPVANVTYAKPNAYTLVSKYRVNDPSLAEFTSSQARVFPVINGVAQIYLLESNVIEA